MAANIVQSLRSTFRSGATLPISWRKEQLKALRHMAFDNQEKIISALHNDLRKPKFEVITSELAAVFEDIHLTVNNLDDWTKPEPVERPNITVWGLDKMQLFPEPYGVMLMIAPWNYPIQLSLVPLVGVIAAGNCAVLKPSELAPYTEQVLSEIIPKYLDNSAYSVVTGGVPETTDLLEQKFDHILYTGSTATGKIVMQAAAKHLTPVTLELGGKSPCIVDSTCDLYVAARRIAFGKLFNSGQSCIAPDYLLIEKSVKEEFLKQYEKVVLAMHGNDAQQSDSYGRIVNERHFDRLSKLLKNAEVVMGGKVDKEDLYIAPTVLNNVQLDDAVMQEEIFGPILPVIAYEKLEDAVNIINDRDKPLALYIFSTNPKDIDTVKKTTSSGAYLVNDTMSHAACNTLPFGGVGPSGIGAYHGKHSFDTFSHWKPCLFKFPALEQANETRMAPYNERKLKAAQWAMGYPAQRDQHNSIQFSKFVNKDTLLVACLLATILYIAQN